MTTTTNGETFTREEHIDLARLIYKRFGRDSEAACAAWRRLLENQCPVTDFMALVANPMHTHHCCEQCMFCAVSVVGYFEPAICPNCGNGYVGRVKESRIDGRHESIFRCDRCSYSVTMTHTGRDGR